MEEKNKQLCKWGEKGKILYGEGKTAKLCKRGGKNKQNGASGKVKKKTNKFRDGKDKRIIKIISGCLVRAG